ncbi:MAG: glycine cleavage system regulatory protein-like protein, partial [Candidatus Magnetoglobus multicellularis str. Araruama]
EGKLKAELEEKFKDLTFIYAEAASDKEKPLETINLVVECKDRSGLTKDINSIISGNELQVDRMDFDRYEVSGIGVAVFSAKLSISVPEGTDKETIAEYFEEMPDDVRVKLV